jgi:hypothetical protein
MPRTEDIEKFAQVLNSLGDEPAIRAARSETIEAVPPPGAEPSPPDTPGEAESLQNIFESLSSLPEDGEARERSAPGAADEGLDFASLFGEETVPEGIEELETQSPEADSAPESGPLDDLGSFSADAVDESSESPAEPESTESFDLPNLDDLSFTEPTGQEPSFDAPADSFEAPAPSSLDESMPSLDESMPSPDEPMSSLDEPMSSLDEPMPSLDEPSFDQAEQSEPAEPTESEPAEPAAPPEEPGIAGFDLDSATLADGGSGGGLDEYPTEPGMESLGEESLGDLNLDQFSLPESAEQFGLPEAAVSKPDAGPAPAARPRGAERARPAKKARPAERAPRPQPRAPSVQAGVGEGEIELTPEQFAQLKRVLESLPRNLKIAVQDLIGEGAVSGADLSALINLLLQGAAAQEIATLAGRISGKRIRIPAGYEKKTGAAFEAEQRTFAYAFRENFLPLLRVVAITLLAGGLFGFLGYNYVYRPLFAYSNYRAGYAQIGNDRFVIANEKFDRATKVWPLKRWYYSYAEAFAAKRQYLLAERKYDDLLKAYPGDRRGILDYARMESTRLADYEKADSLLKQILDAHMYDYDALLASGDNLLLWAERDTAKYESARLAYAMLLSKYGTRDELLFRMLRYFIRTNKGEEVERLRAYYATQPEVKIDASVFAELGGYLVDHRRLDYAQQVLFRADKNQPNMWEVHYNLARYYRIVDSPGDEKKALDAAATLLERTKSSDPVTRRRLTVEIDTHTRRGEYYYREQQYLPAQAELQKAVGLVESNQRMKLIGKDRIFGRPYAVLGDLSYWITGDLQNAAQQYRKAIDNSYTGAELTYKIGYVQYSQKDYKSALESFTAAEDASAYPSANETLPPAAETGAPVITRPAGQPPQNLLYALGDTFFQRGDYFAAQGYFLRALERLETRRAALGILHPEDRPDDRALLDSLVKVNNNLGVTMYRLAERTGDRKKRSEALVYLSTANEIASSLARSPDTVRRSEDRALPWLNMRGILYPVTEFVLQPYFQLPKDFQASTW